MPNYPIPKYRFRVQVTNGTLSIPGNFKEVTGLNVSTEVIEYREGGMAENYKIIQPGMQTWEEVTLKKGVFQGQDQNEMWNWWTYTAEEKMANFEAEGRMDLIIQLMSNQNPQQPVVTWTLNNAWPTKISFDDLNAETNEIEIETMTLRHEGLSTRWE